MVTQFCRKLGWNCVEILVSQFQARLQFGVCRELLDLLRLPTLNGLRARSLFKVGITSVAELAGADELIVERALYNALPFESDKAGDAGDVDEARRQMRTIFVTGRDGLTPREAAGLIVKEARSMVENELGVEGVHWEKKSNATQNNSGSIIVSDAIVRMGSGSMSRNEVSEVSARIINDHSEISEKRQKIEENEEEAKLIITEDDEVITVEPQNQKTPVRSFLRISSAKSSDSRSPSLFGDSLGLECDILEQNVIDLDNSVFSDTDLSSFNLPNPSINPQNDGEFLRPEVPIMRSASAESAASTEGNRSESLVWDEDTWNITNAETKKLETPPKPQKTSGLPSKDKSSVDKLRKTTKRRLSSPSVDKSPIINVISYNSPGGISNASNKSEDDVIVASQTMDKTGSAMKTRTRMKLESIRIRTQRSALKTQNPLKDCKTFVCQDCTESVIINSDEDEEVKVNTLRSKVALKTGKEQRDQEKVKKLEIKNLNQRDQHPQEKIKQPEVKDLDMINFDEKFNSDEEDDTKMNPSRTKLKTTKAQKVKKSEIKDLEQKDMRLPQEKMKKSELKDLDIINFNEKFNSDEEEQTKMNPSRAKVVSKTTKPQKVKKPEIKDPELRVPQEKIKKPEFKELDIINITEKSKFTEFKRTLTTKSEISLALACEVYLKDTISIGTKIIGASTLQEPGKRSRRVETCVHNDRRLCGLAMSFGSSVYFLSFDNTPEVSRVPIRERMTLLTELLSSNVVVRCFNTKETWKTLFRCCNLSSGCRFLDPQVAEWLLNPDTPEKTFSNLVQEHLPEALGLLQRLGPLSGPSGPGLNLKSSTSSDTRACTEALITFWMIQALSKKLERVSPKLLRTFQDLEMETVALLARMEMTGLGINLPALQELSTVIQEELAGLEAKAYGLAGKRFNFSSSKSVAGVLGEKDLFN